MRRMLLALTGLVLALAASALAGPRAPAPAKPAAVTATTFVVSGRGWGHGVGMSQYGALGFANDGWTYDQILAHFYVGAALGPAPVARVRVLVGEAKGAVKLRSTVPFRVRDVFGKTYPLAAGELVLGPKLWVTVNGAPTELAGPILFLPGTEPLELDRPYRGQIEVGVTGQKLNAVNVVGLEQYLQGVVRAGDAERLARRGAEGTGGRGALVRASRTASPARASTSTPTCAARSTAASPARARARQPRSRRRRARCCSGRASRSTRSSIRRRAARRSTRSRSSARPCPTSSRSTTRTASSRRSIAGARHRCRDDDPEGAEAARAGDGAQAHARPVRPGAERQRRDGDRHVEDHRRDAARGRRAALDVDHRPGVALARRGRAGRRSTASS